MVLVLGLIGLWLAAVAWDSAGPLAGLVVGFLFVGGAGWKLLFGLLGLARPSSGRAFGPEGKQFILEWERRVGEMRPGQPATHPPPGIFQAWLREYRRTGVGAGEWLDTQYSKRPTADIVRHVALHDDGSGVTFYINRDGGNGRHEASWTFDPSVLERAGESMRLHLDIAVELALTEIEQELGLPVTFGRATPQ